MDIEKISISEWKSKYMNMFYYKTFNEFRNELDEKSDFILIAFHNNSPVGFVTCLELDNETIYWQFGGAFDEIKRSYMVSEKYKGFIEYIKNNYKNYKRITTKIENTNFSMIKLAMKYGFLINGVNSFKNKTFLHLINEFGG